MINDDTLVQEWHFLNRHGGYSFADIAARYGVTRNKIAGAISRYQKILDGRSIVIGTPLVLSGDYMITGDVHIPCTDWAMAERVALVAQRYGVKRLIVAGDFMNYDAFSSWPNVVRPATWEQERDEARKLINAWEQCFDEIIFLAGNHERRLQKWLEGNLTMQDIFALLTTSGKLIISNYAHCRLNSGGVEWRVTHPKNYSRNRLTVASDLALKYDTNIISFHEHHLAVGADVYGRHLIVNGGSLADPERFAYVALEDNRMAAMAIGFAMIKNGCPHLFGRHPFTDWSQ